MTLYSKNDDDVPSKITLVKPKDKTLVGVAGWLAFFEFTLVISTIYNIIIGIMDISKIANMNLDIGTMIWLITLDVILFIGIIGFGIYAICLLSSKSIKNNTIGVAKLYVLLIFLTNLLGVIFSSITSQPIAGETGYFDSSVMVIRSLIFAIIWFLYLTYSKRVNNTYPITKRKLLTIDKVIFFIIIAIPIVTYLVALTLYPQNTISSSQAISPQIRELTYNEYSDGIVYFIKPIGLDINKSYSGLTPIFTMSDIDYNTIIVMSDNSDIDKSEYFDQFFEGYLKGATGGKTLDTYTLQDKYSGKTISGLDYYEKSVVIKGEEDYLIGVTLVYANKSDNIAVVGYMGTLSNKEKLLTYSKQVLDTIKFS